ncbi:protein trichome birefringence-like [Euphorbia lathyris]|uniref:protein trichome birefringence-like n=1 Tax=Euphorbia lathyris TaxID=212925 RepID=UPI00331310EC
MADAATKHFPVNGGTVITDLKSLFVVLKTRRTVAFVYGFMFAFVAVTAFLAFAPSSNSSSPWFSNIFSITTGSFKSPWFTANNNNSSVNDLPSQNTTRSNSSLSLSSNSTNEVPNPGSTVQNQTQVSSSSVNASILQANHSANASSTVNKVLSGAHNYTQGSLNSKSDQALKPNQTTVPVSVVHVPKNETSNTPSAASPPAANQGGNSTSNSQNQNSKFSPNSASVKSPVSNYTASLLKKQSNVTSSPSSGKQGIKSLIQNMVNCDLFDGEWVRDDSYPLYKPGSCSLIDEQFNCIVNGRADKDYQKYKWKPKGCSIPRLDPVNMLNMLRGKRLVFVGDSLNRNMWESLVCMLKGPVKDQSKVFEANGRHHFRGEASYSFIFKDYNCTVEFFVSPFLVQEWEMHDKNGTKETLRLDLVGRSSDQYKDADIIIFNTGHWWTHDKTSKGKDYYQEGSHVYNELNVLEAFRKALTTWARWVDHNINPTKSLVFFRGYSASHFSGGQWNSGGACDSEVEPINNATYLREYPPKMLVLEKVLRGMKTHVTYLNVTQMTDYRKDGHPSIYRKQHVTSAEERKSPLRYQDCSHWCLPGVPDSWNEVLYAELLVDDFQKRQLQKRHR